MNKVLVLGGTNFIGRNLMTSLLALDNFDITMFNRGKTNPHLFPSIKKIIGDRETEDINLIFESKWDYIIDLSCFYSNSLENILKQLNSSLKKYIFISTCSVYDITNSQKGLKDEDTELLDCSSVQKISTSLETYGNRKAECERVLEESRINYTILRPALVYGAHDNTDRLYYWLYQVKMYPEILLPEGGKRNFSITYVHDLVETILKAIQLKNKPSNFNVISKEQTSIEEIVNISKKILSREDNNIINAQANFLKQNNIKEWFDMPLWINSDNWVFSNSKREKTFRITKSTNAFFESLKQTINYYNSINWPRPSYGINNSTKIELLGKLKHLG